MTEGAEARVREAGAGREGERRAALVTGSARGLGRTTGRYLLALGFDVAFDVRRREDVPEKPPEPWRPAPPGAPPEPGRAIVLTGDVSRPDEAEGLVRGALAAFGRLDVLVHAAGPFLKDRTPIAELGPDGWRQMIDANLDSAYYLLRAALPEMRRRRFGRVVLFAFAAADGAPAWPGRAAYAAAKSGLVSLARSLALEEAPHGVTVNVICPGDIVEPWKERPIRAARAVEDEGTPLGRPGTGEDVARAVAFLCEDDSDFVTGSLLQVTGGDVPWRRRRRAAGRG